MNKQSYTVGCDPEVFLTRDGGFIGSERVVPDLKGLVVRDGFQVEFNPPASMSSSILGSWLSQAFIRLDSLVKAHEGVGISLDQVIKVDPNEMSQLSERSRILGSDPSFNVYGTKPILVDGESYPFRSAAGHLHFGLKNDLFDERVRLISWFDVFVGNTSVLIDRNPLAVQRRENYGRAGEYRIPNHGIEYRTPSNFWLRNYTLLDFVLNLADIAIQVVIDGINGGDLESRLIDVVDIAKVAKAIDTNNLDLAWENYKDVAKLGVFGRWSTLNLTMFFENVEKNGLESFFPEDPVTSWIRGKQMSFATFNKMSGSKFKVFKPSIQRYSNADSRFSSEGPNGV
jgi:hypothetical protein